MSKSPTPVSTPTPNKGEVKPQNAAANQRSVFVGAVLDMSWRLAIVVLVPVLLGAELDKKFNSSVYVFVGLALAVVGSIAVLWRTMQEANKLPVPKLTEAQRRKIQKEYEEEDEDR